MDLESASKKLEEMTSRELSKYEEAMRKKDERRYRLQMERDALLTVIQILVEENIMLKKAYEKDSQP